MKTVVVLLLTSIPIVVLYSTSRTLMTMTMSAFLRVTKNKKLAIWLYSLLFLPGIILHEASHVLVALVLLVPIGEVSFFPRLEEVHSQEQIRLGYAQIGKTDIFRSSLIGAAPSILGLILLGIGTRFMFGSSTSLQAIFRSITSVWGLIAVYFGLSISQLMWTSESDREDWVKSLFAISAIGALMYVIFGGVVVTLVPPFVVVSLVQKAIDSIVFGAWFVVGINIILICSIFLIRRMSSMISRK